MKRSFFLIIMLVCCLAGYAQAIIDPLLSEEMARRNDVEQIQVVVIMKSQYDRTQLNRRAEHFVTRAERREFVVNELKSFADASQYDLKCVLSEMEHRGMVSAPTVLWMANALYFDANKAAIQDLAKRNDIAMIGFAVERRCILEREEVSPTMPLSEIMPNVAQVHADQVWDMGYKGQGVVVAVVDSGVNYNHVDLASHLWDGGDEFPHHGYDVYHHDDDPMDDHEYGHGTHCAGIVCGDGTAGKQTGMAPEATLMCVKCTNQNGYCNCALLSEGIQWAVEHGCDIFSLSTCLLNPSGIDRVLLRQICEAALDAGIVAAVAAGNEGDKLDRYPIPNNVRVPSNCPPPYMDEIQGEHPGGLSCVVSVGAVDADDNAAVFTSHGPSAWANTEYEYNDYPYNPGIGLIRPDVCAPGVNIWSLNYEYNNGYRPMSGSSMAAPCVAGCMALMLSKDPNMTPAEVCRILEETAMPLSEGKSNIYGFGRVDALYAVGMVPSSGIRYQDYAINDAAGNNNQRVNPGESVTMSLTLNNIYDQPLGNVSVVLMPESEHVVITNDSVVFPVFAANETLTVEDAFAFSVDEEVEARQKLLFRLEVYVDGVVTGVYRLKILVHDYILDFGALAVLNDPNGDGFLNPGETADLRVMIDNTGNELAPWVTGTLSTTNTLITLNETEKPFGTIDAGMVGYADFSVSLDASANIDLTVPFTLDLVDADGRHTVLTFDYRNVCKVIFSLYDSFNDGWQDNYLQVDYSDGTPSERMTLSDGGSVVFVRELVLNSAFTISWHNSSWSQECSFEITYEDGTVIFQNAGGFEEVFSFAVDCTHGIGVDDFFETKQNVSVFPNPASGAVTIQCLGMRLIEVYSMEGKLLRRIEVDNDTYQIEGLGSGIYLFCIDNQEKFIILHL